MSTTKLWQNLNLGLTLTIALLATAARAEVYVTPKHLLILREGLDTVYGSYIFALQNTGEKPEHFKVPVMLPKETEDFTPQEGLEPSELTLAQNGSVVVEKDVQPGVNLIGIGFRLSGRYGKATMTFNPVMDIDSFILLLPRGSAMQVESNFLKPGDSDSAPDPQYMPWTTNAPMKANELVSIEVSGLPEGRSRLWILGSIVAGMLVLLAAFLAWRTRPKISTDSGSSVLVG